MFTLNICLAINLIILFVAFFFRKQNTLPNQILALLLLDTAISFLGNATVVGGYFTQFPYIFFLSWCTSCFFGPLFFSYTALFTGSQLNLKHPLWISAFLISAFGLVFPVNYLLLQTAARPGFVRSLTTEPLPWEMTVLNVLAMVLILTSMIASQVKVRRYQIRLLTTMSNLETTKLAFIKQFVHLGLILTLATIVFYLTLPQHLVEYLYLPCLITAIYIFILYYAFHYHTLFTRESYVAFLHATLPASDQMQQARNEWTGVFDSELQVLATKAVTYLDDNESFVEPDLTLDALADRLNVSSDKLSTAINRQLQKNFFELINEKRVEKAKTLLNENINSSTVETIAYAAGFNSRASFYRAFKKQTGATPLEYLKASANSATLPAK